MSGRRERAHSNSPQISFSGKVSRHISIRCFIYNPENLTPLLFPSATVILPRVRSSLSDILLRNSPLCPMKEFCCPICSCLLLPALCLSPCCPLYTRWPPNPMSQSYCLSFQISGKRTHPCFFLLKALFFYHAHELWESLLHSKKRTTAAIFSSASASSASFNLQVLRSRNHLCDLLIVKDTWSAVHSLFCLMLTDQCSPRKKHLAILLNRGARFIWSREVARIISPPKLFWKPVLSLCSHSNYYPQVLPYYFFL